MAKPNRLTHLGGLSATAFLRDYWQKKPLLVRNAFPHFDAPLTKREVMTLAGRDEAESRLFMLQDEAWSVQHGPFSRKHLSSLRRPNSAVKWTVLIQDIQHFSHEAHALLAEFDFIGQARIDNLMVSYAVPGGGVGPHVDSYDVFLLQGIGQRRWQISNQRDCALDADRPVKILKRFKPQQEWILNPGDMLYLPPGVAHHGVAETECMTWSIGFRAPSQQELGGAYLDYLSDQVAEGGQYTDPTLTRARAAGHIGRAMRSRLRQMASATLIDADDPALIERFCGIYLTTPKPQVFFDPPETPLSAARFEARARTLGLRLDLRSRCLYDDVRLYLNGEAIDALPLVALADRRVLSAPDMKIMDRPLWAKLYSAYRAGYLHHGEKL